MQIRKLAAATLLASTSVMATVPAAHAQSTPVRQTTFDIPAGDLVTALRKFSRQARVEVIFSASELRGRRTSGVTGALSPQEALDRIISGSGAELVRDPSGAYLVRVLNGQSAARNPTRVSSYGDDTVSTTEDIVVTGTNIRGSAPIGSSVTVIDREELRRSGYGRVQDYFETLPANFSGGAAEDASFDHGGSSSATNRAAGQNIDLRGLGPGGTLVLVNGRRQAAGGTEGSFTDISSIPAAAIERVEILNDGASALYGTDAVAGVVNFIFRRNFEGLETAARIGTTASGSTELILSAVAGTNWSNGNILVGYQYSDNEQVFSDDTYYGRLNMDFRQLGGGDYRSFYSDPGTILNSSGQAAFAIPAGQNGVALQPSQLIPGRNTVDNVTGNAVTGSQRTHTAFMSLTHRFSDTVELYADGRFAHRDASRDSGYPLAIFAVPSTNPFYVNAFGNGNPVQVAFQLRDEPIITYGEVSTFTGAAGLRVDVGGDWQIDASGSYSRERNRSGLHNNISTARSVQCVSGLPNSGCPGAPLNLFGAGVEQDPLTLAYLKASTYGQGTFESRQVTILANGTLFRLPAGPVRLALGADYRKDALDAHRGNIDFVTGADLPVVNSVGTLGREVKAVFGEIAIPILGAIGDRTTPSLAVSAAARYEDYSDFGDTINPKFGITYEPIHGVRIRGSWGTSFRAPRFYELSGSANPSRVTGSLNFRDPRSPNGLSNVLRLQGANQNLTEETATSWTAGIDFEPQFAPGLRLSGTYFDIDYKNRIRVGGEASFTLNFEERWASIITRDPSAAQVAELCGSPDFTGTCGSNIAAIIDERLSNLAGLQVSGIDFDLDYKTETGLGLFRLGARGTYYTRYDLKISPDDDEPTNFANSPGRPLRFRARGRVGWSSGEVSSDIFVNYANSYPNPTTGDRISSSTTVDAQVGFDIPEEGYRFQIAATNLFNQQPPFVDSNLGYDRANANDIGRVLRVSVTKRW